MSRVSEPPLWLLKLDAIAFDQFANSSEHFANNSAFNVLEEARTSHMATLSTPLAARSSRTYFGPFITVTVLYFIFGFITTLNMALVPLLRSIFNLPYAWAMLAESAFFLAYFVFASPTSKLIESIGYKRTMVVSLFMQVVGCLIFVPAARLVSFPLFLTAVFVVGAGVTALQTSANPYVSILGHEHSAPVRLTLAQAFNSIGATTAPLVAGAYILNDTARLATKAAVADTVRTPYLLIAGSLLLLGVAVSFMHLPAIATPSLRPTKEGAPILGRSIWGYRHTVLGAVGVFFYVGVEVGLASIAINYFKTQGVGGTTSASFLVSLYWFGALVGRLLGSWVLTKIKCGKLLGVFGFSAAALIGVSMVTSGPVAIWTLVLCGFFNSIMFPNIFALGIAGLGPMTSNGSGLIMTAVVGGALIPLLIGALADLLGKMGDAANLQHSLVIPILCYLFIAYYGLLGSTRTRTLSA
jgi:FHS family L-fucose permease-like MFS transporter